MNIIAHVFFTTPEVQRCQFCLIRKTSEMHVSSGKEYMCDNTHRKFRDYLLLSRLYALDLAQLEGISLGLARQDAIRLDEMR